MIHKNKIWVLLNVFLAVFQWNLLEIVLSESFCVAYQSVETRSQIFDDCLSWKTEWICSLGKKNITAEVDLNELWEYCGRLSSIAMCPFLLLFGFFVWALVDFEGSFKANYAEDDWKLVYNKFSFWPMCTLLTWKGKNIGYRL